MKVLFKRYCVLLISTFKELEDRWLKLAIKHMVKVLMVLEEDWLVW